MGCWNKTCGLSRLPIHAGTPVYVVPLEETPNDNSRCYSSALFRPGFHFHSIYDDYGGGENSSGIFLDQIMHWYSESVLELEVGENEYHDIAVKREGFNDKHFFETVNEGRLAVSNWKGESSVIDFCMIRKDFVDDLKKNFKFEDYIGGENPYHRYDWSDVLNSVDASIDKMIEIVSKMDEFKLNYSGSIDIPYDIRFKTKEYVALRHMILDRDFSMNFNTFGIIELIKTKISKHLENPSDESRAVIKEMVLENLDAGFMQYVSNMTRHVWAPGCHEGSQQDETKPYLYMAESLKNVVKSIDSRWDEEDLVD